MLDPKILRTQPQLVAAALAKRHTSLDLPAYAELERQRLSMQQRVESLQAERNSLAREIGEKKSRGEDATEALARAGEVNTQLDAHESEFSGLRRAMLDFELLAPNLPDASVPDGADETANQVLRHWGEPRQFDFPPRDHLELGGERMDGETAAKLSGSRFTLLTGELARLQRALAQWMLDIQVEQHDYKEVYVPYLVNREVLVGSGQLPKFAEDLYHTTDPEMVLVPTAEVSLANLVRDSIVEADQLPMRLVAHTPCFRREAGSYGKDTRGMFRQHQFEKVELVQITSPNRSWEALEEMTAHAEAILKALKLPYRCVALCGGDLGFSAAKTYDLEVWLPGQNAYREISSISNCLDFQARRMLARWRNPDTRKAEYLHTLNGSGLAVGRCLIAVLENYQHEDGSVDIPEVLKPYMRGTTRLIAALR